jgi:SAM-dependent methyltransferase/glycosyltransferase involved in cell wall biosynthesis
MAGLMLIALNEEEWDGPRRPMLARWVSLLGAAGIECMATGANSTVELIATRQSVDGRELIVRSAHGPNRALRLTCTGRTNSRETEFTEVPIVVVPPVPLSDHTISLHPVDSPRCVVSAAADPAGIAMVDEAVRSLGGTVSARSTLTADDVGAIFVDLAAPPAAGPEAWDAATQGLVIVATREQAEGTDFVTHGINGLRVSGDASGVSWAVRHLHANPNEALRFALSAKRLTNAASPDFLGRIMRELVEPQSRKRVCIVNTFPVNTPVNGGQRRLRHLAEVLARFADVELLVLSQHAKQPTRCLLAPGFLQIEQPRSESQKDAEDRIHDLLGFPTDDVTAASLATVTPGWAELLADRVPAADLVVSCHPYLAPTIPRIEGQPFVYDSYNAETTFKRTVLPDDVNGNWLAAETERVERQATERADLIVACTAADLGEIRKLDPERTHKGVVVSNGVDTDALPFATDDQRHRARWELLDLAGLDPYSDRPIATFIGSSHAPNLSAAELLIGAARRRPEWVVILAGSHSSVFAEQARPMPENVTLVPVFDEGLLWPLIAGADVAANPMVSGGGSNLKIFDYLAVGSPVLATPTGARGLGRPSQLVELVEPTVDDVIAGLDRLADPATESVRSERVRAGRALVERDFAWQRLGERWSEALGELISGWSGPARPPLDTPHDIVLLEAPPPAADPVIAAMQRIGHAAGGGAPTSREITMDPAFREHLRKAKDNRNVGRELPADARLALPKKALIRAGHALSNEQVVYNEAALAAIERLMEVINDLRRDQLALTERLEAAEATLAGGKTTGRSGPTPPIVPPAPTTTSSPDTARSTSPDLDAFYEAFEDAFRGDADDVAASTAHYLDRLLEVPDGPAIDVGCGRGEWLELLEQAGRPAVGFDTNAVAVERCVAAGLDAVHGDGILHLETVDPGSIAVVSAFHVIEHLEFPDLHRFAVAAHRALMPGGRLLLETPNCLNLQVGSSSFWLDPTHLAPVHPEQLRFLLGHVGFAEVDIFGLHPAEGSTPTDLDPDPARNGLLVEFHRLVFGSLDVAAIATKH